ncbi:MAG: hypothetical protein HY673_04930 [Chloroflexi bacterium]|nr:hypothetical protein [Chloroflexota bacterium]
MADNLSFLLDKSVAHLDRGLVMQRQGNLPEARYNLLKAAGFSLRAAEQAPPPGRENASSSLHRASWRDIPYGRAIFAVYIGATYNGAVFKLERTEHHEDYRGY